MQHRTLTPAEQSKLSNIMNYLNQNPELLYDILNTYDTSNLEDELNDDPDYHHTTIEKLEEYNKLSNEIFTL